MPPHYHKWLYLTEHVIISSVLRFCKRNNFFLSYNFFNSTRPPVTMVMKPPLWLLMSLCNAKFESTYHFLFTYLFIEIISGRSMVTGQWGVSDKNQWHVRGVSAGIEEDTIRKNWVWSQKEWGWEKTWVLGDYLEEGRPWRYWITDWAVQWFRQTINRGK